MRKAIRITVSLIVIAILMGVLCPMFSPAGKALATEAGAEKPAAQPVPAHWAFSKFMWAAVALVFSVMGTSWAQSKIGMAGAGAMAEKPELAGTIIILIAIPETMVILGFVISAMIIFA